jgi:hypothetical protein
VTVPFNDKVARMNVISVLIGAACACRASMAYKCQRCTGLDYLKREWPDEYNPIVDSIANLHGQYRAS